MALDFIDNPVAKPYAESLFALAHEAGAADQVGEDLVAVRDATRSDPMVGEYIRSPRFGWREKTALLQKVLGGRVHELTSKFVCTLVKRGRAAAFADVATVYLSLLDDLHQRERVKLIAAVQPDEAQLESVRKVVMERLGRKGIIEVEVRPELIGGFELRIGDTVVDASVSARLGLLGRKLHDKFADEVRAKAEKFAPVTV